MSAATATPPTTAPDMAGLITHRLAAINAQQTELTRERHALIRHRCLLTMGTETAEQALLALRVAGVDTSPLANALLQQPSRA